MKAVVVSIILWSQVQVLVGPPIHQTPLRNVGGFVLGEPLELEAAVQPVMIAPVKKLVYW